MKKGVGSGDPDPLKNVTDPQHWFSVEILAGVTALATGEKRGEVEVVWAKIDHMRESAAYLRKLDAWCAQLSLPARLLIARDQGIHFLAYGRCVFYLLFVFLKSRLWIRIRMDPHLLELLDLDLDPPGGEK
jgi:hypothetical protein